MGGVARDVARSVGPAGRSRPRRAAAPTAWPGPARRCRAARWPSRRSRRRPGRSRCPARRGRRCGCRRRRAWPRRAPGAARSRPPATWSRTSTSRLLRPSSAAWLGVVGDAQHAEGEREQRRHQADHDQLPGQGPVARVQPLGPARIRARCWSVNISLTGCRRRSDELWHAAPTACDGGLDELHVHRRWMAGSGRCAPGEHQHGVDPSRLRVGGRSGRVSGRIGARSARAVDTRPRVGGDDLQDPI